MGAYTPTQSQKDAAEQRRAKFRQLAKQLSAMPEADRQAIARKLPGIATVEGRALSTINTLLIAAQCPTATLVGGFKQWKKAGRSVRKGEHGLSLWCPFRAKDGEAVADQDEGGKVRFGMGIVFDVSQTQPIDKPLDAPGYEARVEELERSGLNRSDAQGVADAEFRQKEVA